MTPASTPPVPVLTQINWGCRIDHKGRKIKIGRVWDVRLGDALIGQVEYRMITRERKRRGSRVVDARWQSPGWVYRSPGSGTSLEALDGKQDAVNRLVREHEARAQS